MTSAPKAKKRQTRKRQTRLNETFEQTVSGKIGNTEFKFSQSKIEIIRGGTKRATKIEVNVNPSVLRELGNLIQMVLNPPQPVEQAPIQQFQQMPPQQTYYPPPQPPSYAPPPHQYIPQHPTTGPEPYYHIQEPPQPQFTPPHR
jgi:hypothetical protein